MLPGRGTAVELAFYKRYMVAKHAVFGERPLSSRGLQLVGLSLGYATALSAADQLLGLLCVRPDVEVQAFVLRVVDCMLPAGRSLTGVTLREKLSFAATLQHAHFLMLLPSTRRSCPLYVCRATVAAKEAAAEGGAA